MGLRSKITLDSFVPSCACYFRLMMNTWFYLLNPLTLEKRDVRGSRVENYRVDRRWVERLPCVKVLKKSMASSLSGSNRGIMVRSSLQSCFGKESRIG